LLKTLHEEGQPAISQARLVQFKYLEEAYFACRDSLAHSVPYGIEPGLLHISRDALLHPPRQVVTDRQLAPQIDFGNVSPMPTLLLEDDCAIRFSLRDRTVTRVMRFRVFRLYCQIMRGKTASLTNARMRALRSGIEISLVAIVSQQTEMRQLLRCLHGVSWLYLAGFNCGHIAQKWTRRLFGVMRGGPVPL
jgi:hypothetical protein